MISGSRGFLSTAVSPLGIHFIWSSKGPIGWARIRRIVIIENANMRWNWKRHRCCTFRVRSPRTRCGFLYIYVKVYYTRYYKFLALQAYIYRRVMRSACLLINHSYNASSRAQNIVVRCDCYANYTRPVSTFMQLITLPVGPPATRETLVRARRVRWEMLSRSTRALLLSHLDVYTATRWNDVGWYCVTLDWTAIRMKDALRIRSRPLVLLSKIRDCSYIAFLESLKIYLLSY